MWRFIHLSDIHVGHVDNAKNTAHAFSTCIPDILNQLTRDLLALAPDFLLVTGDLAAEGSRDAVFAARDLLDSISIPYYPLGGDSDFACEKGREWFLEAFCARLPVRDTAYSFTHKGLHVVVLDPWWRWADGTLCPFLNGVAGHYRWQIPPHQLMWLDDDLANNAHVPTILAMHCPVYPPPRRLANFFQKELIVLDNRELLFGVLKRHSQVKAIFSGHLHTHYIIADAKIVQIVTAGFSDFPVEYRVVDVFEDRLEVSTKSVNTNFLGKGISSNTSRTYNGHELDRSVAILL